MPEQKPNSEQTVETLDSSSPNSRKPNVSGLPSSTDALKIECLKIANACSASMNGVEENYSRLWSLVSQP